MNNMKKALIVYYSWSNGNTKRIAEMIKSKTDADIIRIDTKYPYEGSYDDVVNQGKEEVDSCFEPEINETEKSVSDYDTIIIGTPTWWYTMAPAMLSFIRQNDFSGKTVIPFMTNGGWPGNVIKDIKKECKNAKFALEKEIQFDSTGGDELITQLNEIEKWTDKISEFLK